MRHTPAIVTSVSSTILAANGGRTFLSLQNLSDTAVFCTVDGSPATIVTGYMLTPNGGMVLWDSEPTVPRAEVRCIHAGEGDKSVVATEATR